MIVVCFVDDPLVFSKHDRDTMKFKRHLDKSFVTNKLSHPTHLLRMKIKWIDGHTVALRQSKLIEKMLATRRAKSTTKAKCPMNASQNDPNDNQSLNDKEASIHCSIIGSLLFTALNTRLDIATAESKLGTFFRSTTKTSGCCSKSA